MAARYGDKSAARKHDFGGRLGQQLVDQAGFASPVHLIVDVALCERQERQRMGQCQRREMNVSGHRGLLCVLLRALHALDEREQCSRHGIRMFDGTEMAAVRNIDEFSAGDSFGERPHHARIAGGVQFAGYHQARCADRFRHRPQFRPSVGHALTPGQTSRVLFVDPAGHGRDEESF